METLECRARGDAGALAKAKYLTQYEVEVWFDHLGWETISREACTRAT